MRCYWSQCKLSDVMSEECSGTDQQGGQQDYHLLWVHSSATDESSTWDVQDCIVLVFKNFAVSQLLWSGKWNSQFIFVVFCQGCHLHIVGHILPFDLLWTYLTVQGQLWIWYVSLSFIFLYSLFRSPIKHWKNPHSHQNHVWWDHFECTDELYHHIQTHWLILYHNFLWVILPSSPWQEVIAIESLGSVWFPDSQVVLSLDLWLIVRESCNLLSLEGTSFSFQCVYGKLKVLVIDAELKLHIIIHLPSHQSVTQLHMCTGFIFLITSEEFTESMFLFLSSTNSLF